MRNLRKLWLWQLLEKFPRQLHTCFPYIVILHLISHNGTCNQFTHVLHVQKKLRYEFNYKCTPQLHQMPQVLPGVWASVIPVIRSAPAAAS